MDNLFDKSFEDLFDSKTGKIKKKQLSKKKVVKKIEEEIDADLEEAKAMGQWEIDQIHSAYMSFFKEVYDLTTFEYLKPFLLKFGEACEGLDALISNNISSIADEEQLTQILGDTSAIRTKLLVDIYNRYKSSIATNDDGDIDASSIPF